jgi:hypothetical protein
MNIKACYNSIRRVSSDICLSANNNVLVGDRVGDSGIVLTIATTLMRSLASISTNAMAYLARLFYISIGGSSRGRAIGSSRRRAINSSGESI